jgi:hypothetical protein
MWARGRDYWNQFVERNPDFDIDFSGVDFAIEYSEWSRSEPGSEWPFRGYHFPNGDVSFVVAKFNAHQCQFEHMTFGTGLVNFTDAKFDNNNLNDKNISFSGSDFGQGEFCFQPQDVEVTIFDFTKVKFGEGKKIFAGTAFKMGQFNFDNTRFGSGDVDFSECVFEGEKTSFDKAVFGKGNISFQGATFQGEVASFENASFGDGNLDFSSCEFNASKANFDHMKCGVGQMLFDNAQFSNSEASFQETCFGDGEISFSDGNFRAIDFSNAQFGEGEKHFICTTFGARSVSFEGVDFHHGNVSFTKANKLSHEGEIDVVGDMNFKNVKFGNGNVDFTDMNFGRNNVDFFEASFGNGNVNFDGCHFNGRRSTFQNARFGEGNKSFSWSVFECADTWFDNVSFGKGEVAFENTRFKGEKLDFSGAFFDESSLSFSSARLDARLNFSEVTLGAYRYNFEDVEFGERANFRWLIDADKVIEFSFQRAAFNNSFEISAESRFGCVIDLLGTKVTHQVSLQDLRCMLQKKYCYESRWWGTPLWAADPQDADRFRRLKELALSNRNNAQAIEFGIQEIQALRWRETTNYGSLLLEFLFWVGSDYGRNVARPFLWLMVIWASCWLLYMTTACIWSAESFFASAVYSVSQMFSIIPGSAQVRANMAIILYDETIPVIVSFLNLAQGLASLMMLFQLGLVIRNKFRV